MGFSSWFWLTLSFNCSCNAGWVCGRTSDGAHSINFHGSPSWLPQGQLGDTPVWTRHLPIKFNSTSTGFSQWISSAFPASDFFLLASNSGSPVEEFPVCQACDSQPVNCGPALTWGNPAKYYMIQGAVPSPRGLGPALRSSAFQVHTLPQP